MVFCRICAGAQAAHGVLSNLGEDDAEGRGRNDAFVQGLQQHGWAVGRNLQIDYRWSNGNADKLRADAADLIALRRTVGQSSS